MFIVTYFIAVCFEEMLVLASWIWQDNSAEMHKNCVKDCTHKLQNCLLVLNELFSVSVNHDL